MKEGITPDFSDFEYVDAATLFALLPYVIGYSAIIVHCVLTTIVVISGYGVYKHYQVTATLPSTPQQQTIVKYQPQIADQQELDFGPWFDRGQVMDRVNNTDFKNIALLSDTGSVKYSQTKVIIDQGFVLTPFHERIVNPRSANNPGQISFEDQVGQNFTVNKNQAFMFEGYASKVFMFDANGKLMTIAQSDVKTN